MAKSSFLFDAYNCLVSVKLFEINVIGFPIWERTAPIAKSDASVVRVHFLL